MSENTCADISIEFAGLMFTISGITSEQANTFSKRFSSSTKNSKRLLHPEILIRVSCASFSSPDMSSLLGRNGEYMPIIEHSNGEIRVQGHDFEGQITISPRLSGHLLVRNQEDLTYPVIENFLRILTAYAVLDQGGLFLHSACVVVDEKAMIFLGCSGAGKSTLSKLALASGANVLSDDANIILPSGKGSFEAALVPFSGELGQVAHAGSGPFEVSGIFWLNRSKGSGIRPINPTLQLTRLMSCASVANVDPLKFDQLLSVIDGILSILPIRELGFSRDSDFRELYKLIIESET